MLNKIVLLNKKPKKNIMYYWIFILMIITSIILSYKIKTYDSYLVTGLNKCEKKCVISFTLPYNKVDILSNKPKIEYLNKEYTIQKIFYQEPYLNNGVPYQDIEIEINLSDKNRLINFKILYNKQRIINKIKNIITEGDENA